MPVAGSKLLSCSDCIYCVIYGSGRVVRSLIQSRVSLLLQRVLSPVQSRNIGVQIQVSVGRRYGNPGIIAFSLNSGLSQAPSSSTQIRARGYRPSPCVASTTANPASSMKPPECDNSRYCLNIRPQGVGPFIETCLFFPFFFSPFAPCNAHSL